MINSEPDRELSIQIRLNHTCSRGRGEGTAGWGGGGGLFFFYSAVFGLIKDLVIYTTCTYTKTADF